MKGEAGGDDEPGSVSPDEDDKTGRLGDNRQADRAEVVETRSPSAHGTGASPRKDVLAGALEVAVIVTAAGGPGPGRAAGAR